ncbi:hypothetical protein Tco_1153429 [Tanacetum coccineum]
MFPRRSDGEESEYPFFEGDGSSSDEWRDYGMAGDDYEGPPIFDDDQYEKESMPVYDTDIKDVIEKEEGFVGKRGFSGEEDNIEDVVVVTNVFCSSIIQTTSNVDFEEDINTKSHELMSFGKSIIIKVSEPKDYGMAGDDYEGPPIFDDDQYEEESMPVYDTDIEDVIEKEEEFVGKRGFSGEEDNIEDVVVVTNVFCSSIIQTASNVDFEEDINVKSHELMSFGKKRSDGEESEYPFFEGDGSSSDEWRDYGMAGDDYERPPIFDDDQYEEESMPVYDTDIEDVIEKEEEFVGKRGFSGEEDNIEDVVVVTNVFCSSIIQTASNVDFEEDINVKSHELMSFGKSIIIMMTSHGSNHSETKQRRRTGPDEARLMRDACNWICCNEKMINEAGHENAAIRSYGQKKTCQMWTQRLVAQS